MTITIYEKWASPRLGEYSAEFETQLFGTDDYLTALSEAQSAIPLTFFNGTVLLYRTELKIDRAAEEIWNVFITYGTPQEHQSQSNQFGSESDFGQQFEIGGGTQRITHAKETVQKYTSGGAGTGVFFGDAINVTESGVEGVDIVVPTLSFSETRNFVASEMSALRAILFGLCSRTNSAPFLGFAVGEVLYVGASGGLTGGNTFGSVTHKFIASPNLTGISVGAINGIDKKGHEYLWIWSQEELDAQNNVVRMYPKQATVNRVYDAADLNNIPNINNFGF